MFFVNRPDLEEREAVGVGEDSFYVECPGGNHLAAVSRYTQDGEMAECDLPCLSQFWFYAGAFAGHRKEAVDL
jgi:hypothetical protein